LDSFYNGPMPKPFDATLKDLIEGFPRDWLDKLGIPITGPIEVLSPELSTVTAAADAVLRVGALVVHIDAESGPDPGLPARLLLYNVLSYRRTGLPVHSAVVLLRPNANAGNLTDTIRYAPRPGGELNFRFEIIKVWESPAEELVAGGLGLLPLAVLGRPPAGQSRRQAIPDIMERVAARALDELPHGRAERVIASALILAGMHLTDEQIEDAIRRLPAVIESVTYRVFEKIGAVKALKQTLLEQGVEKFGKPTKEHKQKIAAIEDVSHLKRLFRRVLKVDDWDALLKGR
jgi:hypothetical protein